jgi:dephospho-CoA kinase
MLKIGLTGGIGSGKSTVAGIFEVLEIPVYYADKAARDLMNRDPEIRAGITMHFGEAAYRNGILDREFLSSQVFSNEEKLRILNAIVHPVTIRDAEDWMQRQSTPYAVKEAALIFESGGKRYLDYVIGVSAPTERRIERTVKRDHITREEVIRRMNSQMDEDKKMKLCDYLVYNDDIQPVLPQVLELHQKFLNAFNKS